MSILEKIYESTLKFLSPLNLEDTYREIINEAVKLTHGEYGTIYWEKAGELHRVSSTMPQSIELRKGGYRYRVFKEGKSTVLNKRKLRRLKVVHPELEEIGARSVLIVPLVNQDRSVGLLTIDSHEDKKFTKKDLETLKLFGSLASLSIRKALLYEEIREALEARDLFISMAAHELRTPLTSVNGYIQLLKNRKNDKQKIPDRWIDELELEANRLKQLVEEFLEINRIKTGKLQYDWKESNLKNIVKRSIESFKFSKPNREVVLKDQIKTGKDEIICDQNKLMQVFINVLENADKYSPKEKNIVVNVQNGKEFFKITFEDQGQGISKKEIPLIFRGFYRGRNSQHEGMGLGLYLARNIINSHHGEISIDSEVGKGTNISIKLPKI